MRFPQTKPDIPRPLLTGTSALRCRGKRMSGAPEVPVEALLAASRPPTAKVEALMRPREIRRPLCLDLAISQNRRSSSSTPRAAVTASSTVSRPTTPAGLLRQGHTSAGSAWGDLNGTSQPRYTRLDDDDPPLAVVIDDFVRRKKPERKPAHERVFLPQRDGEKRMNFPESMGRPASSVAHLIYIQDLKELEPRPQTSYEQQKRKVRTKGLASVWDPHA